MSNVPTSQLRECTKWALSAAVGKIPGTAHHLPDRLVRRTIQQGRLEGLIWLNCRKSGMLTDYVSKATATKIDERVHYLAFIQLHQQLLRERLLAALSSANIKTVLLKGAAIAPLVYPEPIVRSTNDLDILVRERDDQVACDVLHRLGGREHNLFPKRPKSRSQYHEKVFIFQPTPKLSLVVELHTGFAQSFRHPIDYDHWIKRAVPAFDAAWRLRDEDQLVHLAIHSGRELFMGPLKQLVDAHLWISDRHLDWDTVVQIAYDAGAQYMLYELLRLSVDLLKTDVPPKVLQACKPAQSSRLLFRALHRPEEGRLCRRGLRQWMLECTTLMPLLSTHRQRAIFLSRYAQQRAADVFSQVAPAA